MTERKGREILFRGKRTDNEAWVEGDLLHYESGEMAICEGFSKYGYEATEIIGRYKVIPETVGQYTGLKDKNGKRIFEGDIIVVEGEKWCVGYDDMRARFALFHTSWELMRNIPNYCEREVIGNIHDNSKILKGGGENG